MGAYVGAFFIFAYIFISKNKLLSLLSAPIIESKSITYVQPHFSKTPFFALGYTTSKT